MIDPKIKLALANEDMRQHTTIELQCAQKIKLTFGIK